MTPKKKLIEVAMPLEAINTESLHRKQKAPKGFPTSFHKWWAQRPLAACRAVIFASLVDDPSSQPNKFPTKKEQSVERERLLTLTQELVKWDNSQDEHLLAEAWKEILNSTNKNPPALCDPFCGSGSIPLEAQRLGLESYASDLNPVAVLINKAMIEIPSKFPGRPPVNPEIHNDKRLLQKTWTGAQGLAADVRYYARWMRDMAERRIGHLYPKIEITAEMTKERSDLRPLVGHHLPVVAWLWARTVRSPSPAFAHVDVPLASTFVLSTKAGKEAYVEPVIEGDRYRFVVKVRKPKDAGSVKNGTKLAGSNFRCLLSGSPISGDYIKAEGQAGRMRSCIMAMVTEGQRGRIYLPPTPEMESIAGEASPDWRPQGDVPARLTGGTCVPYGLREWGDLFTARQLVALTTFSDLIQDVWAQVRLNALSAAMSDDGVPLEAGGVGATGYADAIAVYLACLLDRMIYYGSSLTTWLPKDNALRDCMPRQGLAMVWDFAEGNPFGKSSGDVLTCANSVANYLDVATPRSTAVVTQCDARMIDGGGRRFLFCTDPPYYNNISYADLSDYFYVWLRRPLKPLFPNLFATLTVPKTEELVALPYRHGSKEKADAFFLGGMTQAIHRLATQAHPDFPVTIYYAFKQSETDDDEGTISTGWETFLEAVIGAGLSIEATWPLRTEGAGRMIARDTNALASSIVLVCRPRPADAYTATRREFVGALKAELPDALIHLQNSNIAPVDLAQAAIGPGMAVYTRYAKVIDAAGVVLTVREALALINQALDEVLAEQESDFDRHSRWALAWFSDHGFEEGPFGNAHTYFVRFNTAENALRSAGIIESGRGKVRLLRPGDLSASWEPEADLRLTAWESVHHLIRVLEAGGENAAAELVAKIGSKAEISRELAYRLYTLCERKKRAQEALSYNGLVQSWPEITRLARESGKPQQSQSQLFDQE
jgi:putative DNA methylase